MYHKPAGLATQSARVGQPDAVSELKKYMAGKAGAGTGVGMVGKPGAGKAGGAKGMQGGAKTGGMKNGAEPYLGIVHRLDQPVEGLLVFAKTKAAAAHLTKQLETGSLNKQYYATVCGKPESESGELVDYLLKEGNLAKVVPQSTPQAKKAVLQYRVLENMPEAGKVPLSEFRTKDRMSAGADDGCPVAVTPAQSISCLDIHIDTGRFHQIRAQLAHAGFPILGDLKYGTAKSAELSKKLGIRNVALFAYKLEFVHPVTGKYMEYKIDSK